MVKRVLVIFVGVIIIVVFSIYILDIDLFKKTDNAAKQQNVSVITSEENLAAASNTEHYNTMQPISAQPAEAQNSYDSIEAFVLEPITTPIIINGKWQLVWRDSFDEPALNYEKWTKVERRDNYNKELQYYSVHNVCIEDGMLYLTATKEEKDGKDYVSGMIQTEFKMSFLYGRIEARMKLPEGKGFFPAFWLLSENYEIDIMEMIGSEPDIVYGVNHSVKNGRKYKTYGYVEEVETSQFHVYALEWEKDELRWYIDDELFYSTDKHVSDEEMFVLFTLAVGGIWPGSPDEDTFFPGSVIIDEISLYKDISNPEESK